MALPWAVIAVPWAFMAVPWQYGLAVQWQWHVKAMEI